MLVDDADESLNPVEAAALEGLKKEEREQFAQQMSERLKGRGDLFDDMVAHEESIRLGDPGWKARYYQVSAATPCRSRCSFLNSTQQTSRVACRPRLGCPRDIRSPSFGAWSRATWRASAGC